MLLRPFQCQENAVRAPAFDTMGLRVPLDDVDRLCLPDLDALRLDIEKKRVPLARFGPDVS